MRDLNACEIELVSGGLTDNDGGDSAVPTWMRKDGVPNQDSATLRDIAPGACALIGVGVAIATKSPAAGALATSACNAVAGSSGQTNSQPDRSTTATASCPTGSTPVTTTSADGTTVATCAPGGAGGTTTTTTKGH